MNISIDAVYAYDKLQHPFMIFKAFQQTRSRRKYKGKPIQEK